MNKDRFIEAVTNLGIEITDKKLDQLEKYYELLIEYNKVMNLTGITEKKEVYLKHFYDSLTIAKIINLKNEDSLCDLGSGAGFPGIVIKIFYPNLKIVLVDSLNKRINFLNIVIKELELENIEAIHTRIEEYAKENKEKFDVVTARAVAPLNILLELGINLVKPKKYFIAMKGNIENEPSYENAIKQLNCSLGNIVKFKLPIEESNRSLIKIIKEKSTSKLFPRKYSEIKKRPL
ncbi:MAG: 16S rRNA (guanine(527)-N(7))-methyltransferase RsmG [Bacilli bacterium]|nr:16S rRNA (guanine(527)-N(7))-methyltransferase RsmG [Bacilli bacterium]